MKLNIIQGRLLRITAGITVAVLIFLANGAGAVPQEQWNKTFGGAEDDLVSSVVQTSDGGYVMAGQTYSSGSGDDDAWLIKTDADGTEIWNMTFGGILTDVASSVMQTSDGGYILAGHTNSFGSGDADIWLIKTDGDGTELWNRSFGGILTDVASSVVQTTDGGYIMAGYTDSFGSGDADAWLIKTDADGNEIWSMTFGDTLTDVASSVMQTSDGGYILAGHTDSFGSGDADAWLIKTDMDGIEDWSMTFGGASYDAASSVVQTSDGGYAMAGETFSFSDGIDKVWLIKTDEKGVEQWNMTSGGSTDEGALYVQQTSDSGYIMAGTISDDQTDALLIKTDVNGIEQWNKTFGGTFNDFAGSVMQTSDGGYILAGGTFSFGEGDNDAWLIKVSEDGGPKGDLNDNGMPSDAGDLVLMKRASIGEITADTRYDLNNNGQFADAGDLVLMKRASIGEIIV